MIMYVTCVTQYTCQIFCAHFVIRIWWMETQSVVEYQPPQVTELFKAIGPN